MIHSLGTLSDPNAYCDPITITGFEKTFLINSLETMLLIRKAEEKIGDKILEGKIKCPCHLGIGQEAAAIGISSILNSGDRVFGAHRSHTHYLALGGDTYPLFAETLGRRDGCSKGLGGSMHLIDQSIGFYGSVPIVGGSVPIATGAGLALKKDGGNGIAVSYFGDGAIEEGAVQESLNLAAALKLPVLFVCENNLFSSHLHIDLRQASNSTKRYADAHGIKGYTVDGNDVCSLTHLLKESEAYLREERKPLFIEAVTYRWRGHVGPHEDIDVGVKRSKDHSQWKKRDPVQRLFAAMKTEGVMTEDAFIKLDQKVQSKINEDWEKAEMSPFPETKELLEVVYKR